MTSFFKVEKLQLENNFYEMITATVSHDMRTPINAIIGLSQNLEVFISDKRGADLLQIIKNSSHFLQSLVHDLLDFFMMSHGKFRVNDSPGDIRNDIIEIV